ncbi:MAG TPA: hypothetical protein VGH98_21845 [Gemmatimonadaceae bacterium]|jgi:hypothetical protein
MTMFRSTLRTLSIALPLLAAGAPALMAQNRTLFTWTGRVDREVQITMRGRDAWINGADRDDRGRVSVASMLPRSDGYVRVQTLDGRGDVSVLQQPNASNNYTTIVRVTDRSSGSDRYRVAAYWDSRYSDNRGGYGRRDGDDGRRDNGGWDNGSGTPSRIDPRDRSNGGWNNGSYGSGTALRWAGNVDGEVEIRLQGRRMDERVLSGGEIRNERSSVVGDMPQRDAQLFISQSSGRGQVYVAQQPSAYNGYTTVIRVRDPQGGYGYYNFEVGYR